MLRLSHLFFLLTRSSLERTLMRSSTMRLKMFWLNSTHHGVDTARLWHQSMRSSERRLELCTQSISYLCTVHTFGWQGGTKLAAANILFKFVVLYVSIPGACVHKAEREVCIYCSTGFNYCETLIDNKLRVSYVCIYMRWYGVVRCNHNLALASLAYY